jgi:hypothetical protein
MKNSQRAFSEASLGKPHRKRRQSCSVKILERLIVKLSDILKSDYEKSEKGRSAGAFRKINWRKHMEIYLILQSCPKFLSKTIPKEGFPESRKKRISELLDVLKSQKIFSHGESREGNTGKYLHLYF